MNRKHDGKRRKCRSPVFSLFPIISPFPTMFFTKSKKKNYHLNQSEIVVCKTNAFNWGKAKVLSLGKGITLSHDKALYDVQ